MTKTSISLILISLLAGCDAPSSTAQAVTSPSSPCDTGGQPVLDGALTIIVSAPLQLVSGTSAPLTATAVDAKGNRTDVSNEVTWSSSNFLAASPDHGTLYAVGTGTATIKAALGTVVGSADVSILGITLMSVELNANTETVRSGVTTLWRATGHYNDGSTVELTAAADWATADAAIAIVDGAGEIRAVAPGMTTVTASIDGQKVSKPLWVADPTFTGLRIDGNATMSSSDAQQLTATGLYSDGSTTDMTAMVGWYTSDGSTASVSEGRVQAISSGTVTISAASGDFLAQLTLTLVD